MHVSDSEGKSVGILESKFNLLQHEFHFNDLEGNLIAKLKTTFSMLNPLKTIYRITDS